MVDTKCWLQTFLASLLCPWTGGVASARELPAPASPFALMAPQSLSDALHLGEQAWAAIAIGMFTAVVALTLLIIIRGRSFSRMQRVPLELLQALASISQERIRVSRNGRDLVEVTGGGA